ncbi:hypothetical protein AWW66_09475 [Micromonospora rosaria]|uniref:Uncharacterized protein n=1 Tax=Micromonospora rosaria TaxID=47874 RepID=A0A136PUR7_9ACTN|nr:hypothetical protein [Micromonospora rosaria]KXK62251.1 hypothetical protein AWW66_09475 [Micromonospora rosaria]
MSTARWVLHLPAAATSAEGVDRLAQALRDSLRHVPALDFGELTISAEDDQSTRRRVWCDAPLGGDRRCALRTNHPDRCLDR